MTPMGVSRVMTGLPAALEKPADCVREWGPGVTLRLTTGADDCRRLRLGDYNK